MLKAVPNKNAGFIILLTSIFTFFFFGEIRNLTTFTRLMDYNNGFSLSSFFLSLLSFSQRPNNSLLIKELLSCKIIGELEIVNKKSIISQLSP